MPNKIEIEVKINGKVAKLSDISDETLANIKKAETKPIEHGDYGYYDNQPSWSRLFVEVKGTVKAYDSNKLEQHHDANRCRSLYVITGNIFKDMQDE